MSHDETQSQTLRLNLLADIQTYRHAEAMLRSKGIKQETWDVAWWARRHLEDRIKNELGWLGGLMGEW